MTDYIENAVNAAKHLGESYVKFNELMYEQYKLGDQLRDQRENLNKAYTEATNQSYEQFVNERIDQMEQEYSQMQDYYQGYNTSYTDSLKKSQDEMFKWLRLSVDSYNASRKFETAQREQMEKTFRDAYANFETPQVDNSAWMQNFQYPFGSTETPKSTKSTTKKKAA